MTTYTPQNADAKVVESVKNMFQSTYPADVLPPKITASKYLCNGELIEWTGKSYDVESPVCVKNEDGSVSKYIVGNIHQIDGDTALQLLDAADKAYDMGRGEWPTATVGNRIDATNKFIQAMIAEREDVVRLLMWEIGKSRSDSEKEFDRTVTYLEETVKAVRERNNTDARLLTASNHVAQVRRSPLGVVLSMGPFNYPLNETFTTLIPAVIMGNTCVVKLPRHGALAMYPLFNAFATCFPKGVVNVFNGRGRETVAPIIKTGKLNSLAFIGSSTAANRLRVQHPKPSRMRCTLGLDAKNAAIILPDADMSNTIQQVISGTLSFCGQRCTAIKIVLVHKSIADKFVKEFSNAVDNVKFGLPWANGIVGPLPEVDKVASMQAYVDDAISKGAKVMNRNGGVVNETFYFPSVVYPVNKSMTLWQDEQFGPVIPIATYDNLTEVIDYLAESQYGQQVSVFGQDPAVIGPLLDLLVHQVCRVNLNGACSRGPDVFPFTARKDSAEGTLDIESAIRAFSIRTMVAFPRTENNHAIASSIITKRTSQFLNNDYIF